MKEYKRLWLHKKINSRARPSIEARLAKLNDLQRIQVDEFMCVLERSGDSGSIWEVLDAILQTTSKEYMAEVFKIYAWSNQFPGND